MANILNFPFDGVKGTLGLNVETVYRVDEVTSGTNAANKVEFFHNVASTTPTQVWTTTVEFTSAISIAQLTLLEKAVRDVKQTPNGSIDISTLDDTLILEKTVPFVTATGTQPS